MPNRLCVPQSNPYNSLTLARCQHPSEKGSASDPLPQSLRPLVGDAQETDIARDGSEAATSDPVTVYIDDHFASSAVAVEILETLGSDTSLGSFAAALLSEIEADRRVLPYLRMRVGERPSLLRKGSAGSSGR